ncbi:hypothetical protein D3C72_1144680 [compost metagenome]
MCSDAAVAILRPVATLPVKLTASTPSSSARPAAAPSPLTRLATPPGKPARSRILNSSQAAPGVCSDGLSTNVLPKAKAGAIFQAGIAIGKFHGVISATTPTGWRLICTPMSGRTDGRFSPP